MALRKDHSLRGPLFFTLAASFLVFPARGGAQLADESGHAASADEVIEEIVVTGTLSDA
jgi:hypothetical protein